MNALSIMSISSASMPNVAPVVMFFTVCHASALSWASMFMTPLNSAVGIMAIASSCVRNGPSTTVSSDQVLSTTFFSL